MVDRAAREDEPLGDLGVARPVGDQAQHLELTRRQVSWIGARRRSRPAWDGGTEGPQTLARELCRRPCAQPLELVQRLRDVAGGFGLGQRARRLIRTPAGPPTL